MLHRYSLTVPSYLCAPDDKVGLDGLAGIFQEGAWQHAGALGVSFTEEDTQVFWALHRLGVRVSRRPRWGEEITVTTWPSRLERLFAMREFTVHQGAELLVEASTAWLVLRARDSRPVPPVRHFPEGDLKGDYPFEMPLGRIPVIPQERTVALLAEATWQRVRPSDADRNEHVNNTRYAQWFADEVPHLLEAALPGLILTFTAETRPGQEYAVITDGADPAQGGAGIAEIHVRDSAAGPEAGPGPKAGPGRKVGPGAGRAEPETMPGQKVGPGPEAGPGDPPSAPAAARCACRLNRVQAAYLYTTTNPPIL